MPEPDESNAPILDNPPLLETVLGVQFSPIQNFTSGHFGWFWKQFLDAAWVKTVEAPCLMDQFETFGEPQSWKLPSLQWIAAPRPDRLQIINADDDRVVQVQNTRFLYNWRKRGAAYPRFVRIFPEFRDRLRDFRSFLEAASLDPIQPNQWEVTYINHLARGELWESPDDWCRVFPGLFASPGPPDGMTFESATGEWHLEIRPRRGRLHITTQHGKLEEGRGEVLVVQLTARGPIHPNQPDGELEQGLIAGHNALVQTFLAISSREAKNYWGMR